MRVRRLFLGVLVLCSVAAGACVSPTGTASPAPGYTPPGTPFGPWHDPLIRSDGAPLGDRNAAITAMSSNGRFLGFTSRMDVMVDQPDEVDGNREAYILDRDTGTVRWLENSVPASRLGGRYEWAPYFVKVSDDGQTALLGDYEFVPNPDVVDPDAEGLPQNGGDVYVYDVPSSSIDLSPDTNCQVDVGTGQPGLPFSQRFCAYGFSKDLSADGQFLVYSAADAAQTVQTVMLQDRGTGEVKALAEFPLLKDFSGVYGVAYEDETGLIDLTLWNADEKATNLSYDHDGNLVSTHERPHFGDYRDGATGGYVYGENRCASLFGSSWQLIYTKLFDTWGMVDLGTPVPQQVIDSTSFENLGNSAWAVEDRLGFPGASPIGPESTWQARQYTNSMSSDCSRLVAIQQTKTISGSLTNNVYQTYQPAKAVYMMDVHTKLLRPLAEPGEFYTYKWWIVGPGHSATWIMRADGMEVANGNLVRSLN